MPNPNLNKNANKNDNQVNSYVLDLETLSAQYDNLLIKYEQAVTNYVNVLQQNSNNYVTINGKEFWGTGSVSTNNNIATIKNCTTLCSQNNTCTGATYNPDKQICFLRSGNGNTNPGSSSNNVAIIPQETQLLLIVQSINNQLTRINSQIQTIVDNSQPLYNKQSSQRMIKTKELLQNFINLNIHREKINKKMQDYADLEKQESTASLMVNSNYYSFLLLLFLAIVFIVLLFKFSSVSSDISQSLPTIQQGGRIK
jgi:hypothetical protein